jgi:hypothetical protein
VYAGLLAITALVFGLSLWGAAWLARAQVGFRTSYGRGRQDGPVPGYAYYPAPAIAPLHGLVAGGWDAMSLEAFHSPNRSRVVLTVSPRPGRSASIDTPSLLERAAHQLLARCSADVAVVEVTSRPTEPSRIGEWTAVASRDGRGWSGLDREAWLVIEAPPDPQGSP